MARLLNDTRFSGKAFRVEGRVAAKFTFIFDYERIDAGRTQERAL